MKSTKSALSAIITLLIVTAASTAHATGVPTVDGSAIISNLQQWYQSAQRWYSQMSSMKPGTLVAEQLGLDSKTVEKSKSQAQQYINALGEVQKTMNSVNECTKYKVAASESLCSQERTLKLSRITAYIVMMEQVKTDYDNLQKAAEEYNSTASSASTGDMMTGGGDTKNGEIETKATALKTAQENLAKNMQKHGEFIQSIESNIKMVNEVRKDVARLQFEGNSGGLSDILTKAAVSATLITAAQRYESEAEDTRESAQIQMGKTTKTGTNY